MKRGFYYNLAYEGMRKNKKMYIPYLLTCICMVMMLYIIQYLKHSEVIQNGRGGTTVCMTMGLGGWVIGIFSLIFLFYTNSFLMRRRSKEFGLYNMLGMSKKNIVHILCWETFMTFVISVVVGLVCGIIFSKLAELLMLKILTGQASYGISVSSEGILVTTAAFAAIFFLLLLNSIRRVHAGTTISLIRSENVGEKPPKANRILGVGGFVLLAAAYYLAVSITDPLSAMIWFFVAVIMVIVATYMIFISGMVLLCKILQKNKKYYYKAAHFVSVSSMTYRMKRNGAGLASICILATMVLVMISSTTSLYFGTEDALNTRYPREINNTFWMESMNELSDATIKEYTQIVRDHAKDCGASPSNVMTCRFLSANASVEDGGRIIWKDVDERATDFAALVRLVLLPLEDYNKLAGTQESLKDNEALVCTKRTSYKENTVSVEQMPEYKVKKQVAFTELGTIEPTDTLPLLLVVVPDLEKAAADVDWENAKDRYGNSEMLKKWVYNFNTGGMDAAAQINFMSDYNGGLSTAFGEKGIMSIAHMTESLEGNKEDFYGTYGGLFFLAIVLSVVFIFAAVLIIYYKQISEGYEDQNKFAIMQKVGMTKGEIRKSINSQVLTVFFLPLLLAGLHMAFAFPMVQRVLSLFSLTNAQLFMLTTGISFAAFAVLYVIVYRITSKAYYNIVS